MNGPLSYLPNIFFFCKKTFCWHKKIILPKSLKPEKKTRLVFNCFPMSPWRLLPSPQSWVISVQSSCQKDYQIRSTVCTCTSYILLHLFWEWTPAWSSLSSDVVSSEVMLVKKACCAGCRRRPFPMHATPPLGKIHPFSKMAVKSPAYGRHWISGCVHIEVQKEETTNFGGLHFFGKFFWKWFRICRYQTPDSKTS